MLLKFRLVVANDDDLDDAHIHDNDLVAVASLILRNSRILYTSFVQWKLCKDSSNIEQVNLV